MRSDSRRSALPPSVRVGLADGPPSLDQEVGQRPGGIRCSSPPTHRQSFPCSAPGLLALAALLV